MSQDYRKNRIIPELDGVRGIAILMVLIFHFGKVPPAGIPRILPLPMRLGWAGVDLFFVLSGFLISGILLDTKTASNYFQSFYARRILRIFPIYFLTILVYFHLALPLALHFGHSRTGHNAPEIWYWLHVSNWRSAFQTPGVSAVNPAYDVPLLTHYWSLAIEEQFYLVWPFFVFLLDTSWLLFASSVLVLVPLCLRLAYIHNQFGHEFLYRLTPFRVDSLALGCLVAIVMRNERWRAAIAPWVRYAAVGAALLISGCLVVQRSPSNVGPAMQSIGYTGFAVLFATLIWCAVSGSAPRLCAQLRQPFLRAFGKYSYAIYIFHYPIAFFTSRTVDRIANRFSEPTRISLWFCSTLVGILASFAVALVSWNVIERRFLALKGRFAPRYLQQTQHGRDEAEAHSTLSITSVNRLN